MLRASLTSEAVWSGGKLCHWYEAPSGSYLVHDSARNMLKAVELLADPIFDPDERAAILARLLFPDQTSAPRPEDFAEDAAAILWDACGVDLTGAHEDEHEAPVFDWDEDAGRIKASLRMAYSMDWERASRELTYAELCDYLSMLLESESKTPFQEAVFYRTAKPPKRDKYNAEQIADFERRKRHYRLGRTAQTTAQAARENERVINDMLARMAV